MTVSLIAEWAAAGFSVGYWTCLLQNAVWLSLCLSWLVQLHKAMILWPHRPLLGFMELALLDYIGGLVVHLWFDLQSFLLPFSQFLAGVHSVGCSFASESAANVVSLFIEQCLIASILKLYACSSGSGMWQGYLLHSGLPGQSLMDSHDMETAFCSYKNGSVSGSKVWEALHGLSAPLFDSQW